ncbi:hypothetical protein K1719_033600 [Acacia pycnantha]|nr:hypothetical protein K1719_033600 [Acacia pycnantha]
MARSQILFTTMNHEWHIELVIWIDYRHKIFLLKLFPSTHFTSCLFRPNPSFLSSTLYVLSESPVENLLSVSEGLSIHYWNLKKDEGRLQWAKGQRNFTYFDCCYVLDYSYWTWEKTPGLTAFLPPQTQLQLSSDEDVDGDGSPLTKMKSTNKQEELQSNRVTQTVSAKSFSGRSIDESWQ